MAQAAPETLKRTPFYDIHASLGAKLVPFAGYEMPVQYPTGITAEHNAVRQKCGLFDVSHMGEFEIRGPGAVDFVNYVTTNNVAALAVGQAHYSTILNERGTIEDDCLVYRFENKLMMVVNASNKNKDLNHIQKYASDFDVEIEDISDDIALLALQGPRAKEIMARHTDTDLDAIKYYHFAEGRVAGFPSIISRTGYTGEDGFELYFDPANGAAEKIWKALTTGNEVTPAGLGSRDSLRLEMGMALYGNDLDDTVTPLEANLAWLVKLAKGPFVGSEALQKQKTEGLKGKLTGFIAQERSIPRHGYKVFYQGEEHGVVKSGTMSPTLGIPIGTCYLPTEGTKEGASLELEIRGKRIPATVTKMPFYKGGSHL